MFIFSANSCNVAGCSCTLSLFLYFTLSPESVVVVIVVVVVDDDDDDDAVYS